MGDCSPRKLRWVYIHPRAQNYGHVWAIRNSIVKRISYRRQPLELLAFFFVRIFCHRPCILGANYDPVNFGVLFCLCLTRGSLVLHFSHSEFSPYGAFLFRKLLKYSIADIRIAFTTRTLAKSFLANYAFRGKSGVVWHSSPVIALSNSKIPFQGRSYDVAFFGRLEKERGVSQLLLLSKLMPSTKFVVAGKGRLEDVVVDHCREQGNIDFIGYLSSASQKKLLLENCRVILSLAEKEELFGIAIVEALAHRCIPVCPRDFGPEEILGADYPFMFQKGSGLAIVKALVLEALNSEEVGIVFSEKVRAVFNERQIYARWSTLLTQSKFS